MIGFPEELIKEYSVQPRLGTFENALEIAHFFEKQFVGYYKLKSVERYSSTFVLDDEDDEVYNSKFELKIYFREKRDGYRSEIQLGIAPDVFHDAKEVYDFIEMCKRIWLLDNIESRKRIFYKLRKKFPEITSQFLKEMFE